MRGLRSTLILIVVLAGLTGYIYYLNGKDKNGGSSDSKEKPFASVKAEDIEDIQIKSADGQTSHLQKTNGTWKIVEPEQVEADQNEVMSITSSLATLEFQRVVDENASDLKQYNLDPPRIEVAFKAKGDKDPRRIFFGERTPTGGDLYARLPDKKRVLLVSSFLDSTFNKNTFALREKGIIKIDRDKVDRVEVKAGKRPDVTLVKMGTEWRLVAPIMARADFAAVEGALERLSSAQMQGITDPNGGDLKKYKLDPPVATFTAVAGSARASLLFGDEQNAVLYAKDSSRPMVFTVAPTLYMDLVRDVGDFRRKDLFDSRAFTINHIEFKRGADTVTLDKTKGSDGKDTWKNGAGKNVDAMKVDDLLSKVTSLRADSFDATANAALKKPELTVTVKFDESKMEQVTFARAANDGFASRSDEPGSAKFMASTLDDVLKAIDAVK